MTIAVLGEALIDLIACDGDVYRPHPGGSPYNVAIGLARQGIDVSYLSSLSDDAFGDQLFDSLVREGVHIPLKRRSFRPTSLALVKIDQTGRATYRLYREGVADKDTSFEEIVGNLPEDLRIFHTGSLAITPSQLPKIYQLLAFMRARNVLVSIDINIRLRASIDTKRYLDGVRSLLKSADIVKASGEDLEAFELGTDVPGCAEIIYREMESGMLILTEGTSGATVFEKRGSVSRRAYPVANPVDTVGAGDSFYSAFLAYLYRSGEISVSIDEINVDVLGDALDFGCAAAAISVSRAGCSPPSEREVCEFAAAISR